MGRAHAVHTQVSFSSIGKLLASEGDNDEKLEAVLSQSVCYVVCCLRPTPGGPSSESRDCTQWRRTLKGRASWVLLRGSERSDPDAQFCRHAFWHQPLCDCRVC